MKSFFQTIMDLKTIVHRALCTVNRLSASCIVNRASQKSNRALCIVNRAPQKVNPASCVPAICPLSESVSARFLLGSCSVSARFLSVSLRCSTRVLTLLLGMLLSANMWGADTKTLTFSLTSNPGGWPTDNSTTLTNYTYTLDKVAYTFGLKNVKCNSGYLMLTSTAVLGLPAIKDYKLTKVVAKNSGGCSTSTKVGISSSSSSDSYISGGAIQTWSTQSSTYTYNLSGTSNNTVYYLYVTNKNAQITELALTYEGGTASTTVTLNANTNGKTNGLVKYTVGNATPDATPTWVAPKDNTGWTLYGYYTAASGGTKVISSSNALITSASTYVDSNGKWKYTTTTLTLYAQWGTTTCATPSNLGQNNITATSATLTWSVVTGAASYTVYITGASSYEKTINNITTNSTTLNDLSPNTEYMWSVQAIGDASKGYADGLVNGNGYFTTEAACTNEITITQGTPSNGSFSLSQTGTVCIDEGNAIVNVMNITPATHYHFLQITATNGSVDNTNKQVTNISANTTINVEFEEDTKYTITFVDAVHGTDCSAWNMNSYAGTQIVFNSITDKTAVAPTGDCVADHYHFVGWVEEGTTPTQSPSNVIPAGTTSIKITKDITYKAVWAQEEL